MSEPRHVWLDIDEHDTPKVCEWYADGGVEWRSRYTLTDGDEYRALIERLREALGTPDYKHAMLKTDALRDLLAYLEGDK